MSLSVVLLGVAAVALVVAGVLKLRQKSQASVAAPTVTAPAPAATAADPAVSVDAAK